MLEVVKELREGEAFLPSSCARTRRVMKLNGKWYFLTRESTTPLGPYLTAADAAKAVQDFVDFAAVADESMTARCYEYLANAG